MCKQYILDNLLHWMSRDHNILHDIDSGEGWTPVMRQLRGLLFTYGRPGKLDDIRLVSCGFEKFFNRGEVPDTRDENLPMESPVLIRSRKTVPWWSISSMLA